MGRPGLPGGAASPHAGQERKSETADFTLARAEQHLACRCPLSCHPQCASQSFRWVLPTEGPSCCHYSFFLSVFTFIAGWYFYFLKTTNYSMPVWRRAQSTSHGCVVAGMKLEFQFRDSPPPSLPSAQTSCLTVEAPSISDTHQTQAGNAKCCARGSREQRHQNPEPGHLVQS